jgi:hypothetical protein
MQYTILIKSIITVYFESLLSWTQHNNGWHNEYDSTEYSFSDPSQEGAVLQNYEGCLDTVAKYVWTYYLLSDTPQDKEDG